jgi:Hemopexin
MSTWNQIDTAWAVPFVVGESSTPNPKVYFFSGDEYARYDVASDEVEFVRPISGHWDVLSSGVTGGMVWPNQGGNPDHAYFFSGMNYCKYDLVGDRVYPGYENGMPVAGNWPGVITDSESVESFVASGAFVASNQAFLFSYGWPEGVGSEEMLGFQQVSLADHSAQGPLSIFAHPWLDNPVPPGWLPGNQMINAVAAWPTSTSPASWWPTNVAYFFNGLYYSKINIETWEPVEAAPRLISEGWHGLPMAAPVTTPGPIGQPSPPSGPPTPVH